MYQFGAVAVDQMQLEADVRTVTIPPAQNGAFVMPTAPPVTRIASLLLAVALLLTACGGPPAPPPLPPNAAVAAARAAFTTWAADNGEPYRDQQVVEEADDGVFAQVHITAWFRPTADADWEERETRLECRKVGGEWQCDSDLHFVATVDELLRRAATATAIAAPTATAQAVAQATAAARATAQAQATATAQAAAQVTADAQATAQVQATATALAAALAASIADAPDSAAQLGFTSVQTDQGNGVITAVNPRNGAVYVYVPAGEFLMGMPTSSGQVNAQPQHVVYLDAYWIMQTEVTNAQYTACVGIGECPAPQNGTWSDPASADLPVTDITFNQALDYAKWVGGNLPSEEQWEKAARGTDGRLHPWGDEAPTCERLNFNNCLAFPTAVGSFAGDVSPYGVLDMAGNVTEWTLDRYTPNYFVATPTSRQARPTPTTARAVRGGAYDSNASRARAAYRGFSEPGERSGVLGFRVVSHSP